MNIETKRRSCRTIALLFLLFAAFWTIAVPVFVYILVHQNFRIN